MNSKVHVIQVSYYLNYSWSNLNFTSNSRYHELQKSTLDSLYWKSLYNLSQALFVKQSIRNIIAWRNGGVQLINSWFNSVLVYGSRYVQRYHLWTNIATHKQTRIRRWNQPLFMSLFSLPSTNNYLFQGHKRSLKGKWCHKRCHKRHHRMPKEQINLQ